MHGRRLLAFLLLGLLITSRPASHLWTNAPNPPTHSDWADEILYFIVLDRFADGDPSNNKQVDIKQKGTFHGGDLKGILAQLPEIAELGVTAIWITPVVKNIDGFVTGAGFPDWGYHGYWADDFTKVDPRFGTEEQLQMFVEECHRRGIKVLLDVVYNHAGYNSQYAKNPKYRGWIRTEENRSCGQDDLTSCLFGLPDFKTEFSEVADYLMDAHLSLAKRVGLDGFRLDTVKHVDHPFWKEHRKRTKSELGENFFLLGEVWGGDSQVLDAWFMDDEMNAGFDFSFQGSVISFLQGRGRSIAFDRFLKSREKIRPGYLVSHFLSSHDVPGTLFQFNGDVTLFRLAALLQLTTAGMPMIYYGEEVGRPGGDWPDNRSDMPWGEKQILPGAGLPRNESLRNDYRKLIAIRKSHPALYRGSHTSLLAEGDLLVFLKEDSVSGDSVVVALNRGAQKAVAGVDAPSAWKAFSSARDVWNEEDVSMENGKLNFELNARHARILVAKKP